jgi:hypothetical protein
MGIMGEQLQSKTNEKSATGETRPAAASEAGPVTPVKPGGPPPKLSGPAKFVSLSDMKKDERKWRSTLTVEDQMVVALMKRMLYEGQPVSSIAAYNGLRDAMGYLLAEVRKKNPDHASLIDDYFAKGDDGSNDSKMQPPPPNP